jgi:hypothetical protein
MSAGKQALAMRGGMDDPFTNVTPFTPPHHGRGSAKLESTDGELEALPTPNTARHRTLVNMGLDTDPELGPCFSVDDSAAILGGIVAGQPSFTRVSDFQLHPNAPHDLDPALELENLSRADFETAYISGGHSALMLAPNTPDFSPGLHYHMAVQTASDAARHQNSSAAPSRRAGGPTSHPRQGGAPISVLATPPRSGQAKTGQRRKRADSDSEGTEYTPPAKKAYLGHV